MNTSWSWALRRGGWLLFVMSPGLGATVRGVAQEPIVQIRIARTIKSVTYRPNSGQTTIGFQGTPLQGRTQGRARIQNRQGVTQIEGELSRLSPANSFGAPYLTYVLWAITPEGSASNLGELVLNGSNARIKASTNLQSFGLVVTAEPYFAISVPSEMVVAENTILPETRGKIEAVDAEGRPQHAGDMRAQIGLALDNLEAVLAAAGLSLADVTRLGVFVTDVDAALGNFDLLGERFGRHAVAPPMTLVGVTRLAVPGLMFEIEATAAA